MKMDETRTANQRRRLRRRHGSLVNPPRAVVAAVRARFVPGIAAEVTAGAVPTISARPGAPSADGGTAATWADLRVSNTRPRG